MNDGLSGCNCGCNCGCNNNGGLFGSFGSFCGGNNSEILLFLVVFLLLFTSFGCR